MALADHLGIRGRSSPSLAAVSLHLLDNSSPNGPTLDGRDDFHKFERRMPCSRMDDALTP
jgi:hypothetical protein